MNVGAHEQLSYPPERTEQNCVILCLMTLLICRSGYSRSRSTKNLEYYFLTMSVLLISYDGPQQLLLPAII